MILILSFVYSNLFSAAAGGHDTCRHGYHCEMEHIQCANSVVSGMLSPFIAIGIVLVWCSIGSILSSEWLRYLTLQCDPDVPLTNTLLGSHYCVSQGTALSSTN